MSFPSLLMGEFLQRARRRASARGPDGYAAVAGGWVDRLKFRVIGMSPCLLRGTIRVVAAGQRQGRYACGSGSNRPDSPYAPDPALWALDDPCAGSLLDRRANTSVARGGKRGPRVSEAGPHKHRGGAPQGAPAPVMCRPLSR